ncbi:uncharacterized protein LOC124152709 isoform X2 [Haliotis rufescens]|uniref:uncharacterized protein LOC124152709 isoform X2 n=1 Tax=Haliotis rufescens TaxID=6454 RepID=UPI00201F408B|nr:uncharacterized protein LOC124152709 isoform X2 [Haliotis rufescens]
MTCSAVYKYYWKLFILLKNCNQLTSKMRYMVLIMIAFVYGVNASIRGGGGRGGSVDQLQDVVAKMEDGPVDEVTLLRRGAQIIKRRIQNLEGLVVRLNRRKGLCNKGLCSDALPLHRSRHGFAPLPPDPIPS